MLFFWPAQKLWRAKKSILAKKTCTRLMNLSIHEPFFDLIGRRTFLGEKYSAQKNSRFVPTEAPDAWIQSILFSSNWLEIKRHP